MNKILYSILQKVAALWRRITRKVTATPANPGDTNRVYPDVKENGSKATGETPAAKEQKDICPGVYANPKRTRRLVIAIAGRHVVYSLDNDNAPGIRLTTCSARTFTSAGIKLARAFTAAEVASMMSKAFSLRPRRRCNRFQRRLFFGANRLPGLPDSSRRNSARPELGSSDTNPELARARLSAAWHDRLCKWLKGLLITFSGRVQTAVVPPIQVAEVT